MSGASAIAASPAARSSADPLVHRAAILRLHSYRATVAAIAAFSDSARDRDVRDLVARGDDLGGQALALGADDERHVAVGIARERLAAVRATSAIRRPGSSAGSRTRATRDRRTARPSRRARPCARTGRRCPGPSATLRGAERERAAQRGADVAGVVDAPQRQAQRPGRRRRPALRVDAERARARAELRDARRAGAARPRRPRARSPRRRSAPSAPSRRRRRRPAGPRPRRRTARSLSRHLRPASLRISLSCSLWGLVMVTGLKRKRAPLRWEGRPVRGVSAGSGRRRLAGALGESAEGLGVAHGDVGEHLAVELDAGQLEAVHERAVASCRSGARRR